MRVRVPPPAPLLLGTHMYATGVKRLRRSRCHPSEVRPTSRLVKIHPETVRRQTRDRFFGCTPLAVPVGRHSREESRLPRNAWSGAPLRLLAPRTNWDFRVIDPRTSPRHSILLPVSRKGALSLPTVEPDL